MDLVWSRNGTFTTPGVYACQRRESYSQMANVILTDRNLIVKCNLSSRLQEKKKKYVSSSFMSETL